MYGLGSAGSQVLLGGFRVCGIGLDLWPPGISVVLRVSGMCLGMDLRGYVIGLVLRGSGINLGHRGLVLVPVSPILMGLVLV